MNDHLIELRIQKENFSFLKEHLINPSEEMNMLELEQSAFVFLRNETLDGQNIYKVVDVLTVSGSEYSHQSPYFLEMKESCLEDVIRKASKLEASVLEVHSHPGQTSVMFSDVDLKGLLDFAPHVMWRLSDKPYFALVVSEHSIDALVWRKRGEKPESIKKVSCGNIELYPTNNTIKYLGDEDEE